MFLTIKFDDKNEKSMLYASITGEFFISFARHLSLMCYYFVFIGYRHAFVGFSMMFIDLLLHVIC